MNCTRLAAVLIAATVETTPAIGTPAALAADVHIGVNIVPPAIAFDAPPRLVVVPGVPHVHYAPDVTVNYFTYGDAYYTYDNGNWFVAHADRGPWSYVERRYVPAPVLRVPNRYYRVPPRLVGGGHWNDHGHRAYTHKSNWHGNDHHGQKGQKNDHGHGTNHGHGDGGHGNGNGNGHKGSGKGHDHH